jgi:hypothetical protein
MNYLKGLKEKQQTEVVGEITKKLLVLYGEANASNEIIEITIKILTQELVKKINLTPENLTEAYEEMANNFWKYRKFTGAGFLSALYESKGKVREIELTDYQKHLQKRIKEAHGL